jgi:hypothetical protein
VAGVHLHGAVGRIECSGFPVVHAVMSEIPLQPLEQGRALLAHRGRGVHLDRPEQGQRPLQLARVATERGEKGVLHDPAADVVGAAYWPLTRHR